jgi:phage/plasmid-like protein (TIGR03299 family)
MADTLNALNNDARNSDNGNGRLIGYTDERGNAWGYAAAYQGAESNHYKGAIPVADVIRRLFFWEPVEAPLTVTLPEIVSEDGVTAAQTFTDPTRKVIVRPDRGTVLHVPSAKYQIHSYRETLVEGLSHIIGDTLNVAGAGILNGGGRAWIQLEHSDTVTNEKTGVSFRPHIMGASSHDGTLPVFYGRGMTVIVCSNTFSMALREAWAEGIKVRHTRHSALNLMTAREALGVIESDADELDKALTALTEHSVTDKEWS